MEAREELLGIAQLAVALIGFSGLISAFRSRDREELQPRDLSALAMIMSSGSLALVFSLPPLPLQLSSRRRTPPRARRTPARRAPRRGPDRHPRQPQSAAERRPTSRAHAAPESRLACVSPVLCALVLGLSATDLGLPRGRGVYVAALIACLLACLTCVAFLLFCFRKPVAENRVT